MQIQVSWKPLDGFSWNFIFEYFTKIRPANSSFMKTTGRIFMEFDIWILYENPSSKFKFHENLTRITGTLHEDQYRLFF